MPNTVIADSPDTDRELERKAEALLLRGVQQANRPLTLDEIFDMVRTGNESFPFSVLRLALWGLLGSGKLLLTNDWRVQQPQP